MFVAGLQKNSLIDFPGKLSAVVFITGCNFKCPYCHNPELARGQYPHKIPLTDVLDFVSQRRTLLDGVVITGGEPALWPHLYAFCRALKQLKIAVKLDTNGSRPDVLRQVFGEGLADYIAMDIKTDPDQYPQLFKEKTDVKDILESIDLIISSGKPYEFRTTCASPFVTMENIDQIGMMIKGANNLFLQKCNRTKNTDQDSSYEILNRNRLVALKQRADSYVLNCEVR